MKRKISRSKIIFADIHIYLSNNKRKASRKISKRLKTLPNNKLSSLNKCKKTDIIQSSLTIMELI